MEILRERFEENAKRQDHDGSTTEKESQGSGGHYPPSVKDFGSAAHSASQPHGSRLAARLGSPSVGESWHVLNTRRCGLNWSAQHSREVYSQESRNLRFFVDVDLDAARSCPVGIACSRRGRFSSAGIDAASGWCFRSFLAARGCADHRSRLSHSWPP